MQSSSICITLSFAAILNLKLLAGNSKNHACSHKKNSERGTLLTTKKTDSKERTNIFGALFQKMRNMTVPIF